jgi:TPR repeat protein
MPVRDYTRKLPPPQPDATAAEFYNSAESIFPVSFNAAILLYRDAILKAQQEKDTATLANAFYRLGKCFMYGHGVRCNPERAEVLFQLAISHGHIRSYYFLMKLYENRDPLKATVLCLQGATNGDIDCQLVMAQGAPDEPEAIYWYRTAAENGHKDARKVVKQYEKRTAGKTRQPETVA